MRNKLALATILAVLVSGAMVASVPAAPTDRPSSFVIAGRGQLLIHGVGLTFAVTGGTGDFRKACGQMHETFLPTGEFRFAFTLYL